MRRRRRWIRGPEGRAGVDRVCERGCRDHAESGTHQTADQRTPVDPSCDIALNQFFFGHVCS